MNNPMMSDPKHALHRLNCHSEESQFEALAQAVELNAKIQFYREEAAKLERDLSHMQFRFNASPKHSLKEKIKMIDKGEYISQTLGEYLIRVFKACCCLVLVCVSVLVVVRFITLIWEVPFLLYISLVLKQHFFRFVRIIFLVCGVSSLVLIGGLDARKLKKITGENIRRARANANSERENQMLQMENQAIQKADDERWRKEREMFDKARRALQNTLNATNSARNAAVNDLEELRRRDVLPEHYLNEGSRELAVCFYLMKNRVVTSLYGEDGAIEKTRQILLDREKLNTLKGIENYAEQSVKNLVAVQGQLNGLHSKVDKLQRTMATSQQGMEEQLSGILKSNASIVTAINQNTKLMEGLRK